MHITGNEKTLASQPNFEGAPEDGVTSDDEGDVIGNCKSSSSLVLQMEVYRPRAKLEVSAPSAMLPI